MAEVIPDKGQAIPEKRCATCRHWDRFNKRQVRGTCNGIPEEEYEKAGHVAQLVVRAADDTSLHGELVTMGDFGCVLHKEKA